MTLKWSENRRFQFLQEYKKHECLWNQNSTKYWNYCTKKQSVNKILKKFNIPKLTESKCQQQIEGITKKVNYPKKKSKLCFFKK